MDSLTFNIKVQRSGVLLVIILKLMPPYHFNKEIESNIIASYSISTYMYIYYAVVCVFLCACACFFFLFHCYILRLFDPK